VADRILIVEDEQKLAALLRDYLAQEGYEATVLHRGDEVEPWVRAHEVDLVLLDLMLPGKNGLEVCKALRATTDVAIIMVTARVDEIDRLLGLELGADDYICKPFSPREVVARVKAVLRRSRRGERGAEGAERGAEGAERGLRLDEAGYRATIGGRDLGLTAVEFQLLKVLADHPGRIYTRDQLMDAMYRDERVVADRTVDSHVKKIRRKIATVLPDREIVHSVYGVGYKYEW
jgi:two-component system response regulator BaeR